jgi:hypothetical protein
LSTDAGNDRYDLAVANLRVAPVDTGGNLCFVGRRSDPAALIIAAGTSMLCRNAGNGSSDAAGSVTGAWQAHGCACLRLRGAGGACLRAGQRGGPDRADRLALRHFLPGINEAFSAARTYICCAHI